MGGDDQRDREDVVARGCVVASRASGFAPLVLRPWEDRLANPFWPSDVEPLTRGECRGLLARGILARDEAIQGPSWGFRPTEEAVAEFSDDGQRARQSALADPDQRLGIILEAIVNPYGVAPGEPIRLFRMSAGELIKHPGWSADPWMVREHDVLQLQELGLVGVSGNDGGVQLWPTMRGREMIERPAEFLERRSQELAVSVERSRFSELAQRFRVGDLAVGSAVNLFGQAIELLRHLL